MWHNFYMEEADLRYWTVREREITVSHPLLLANLYMGTWRRGGGGIRRSHFVAMAHLKAKLWLVRWYQNKHGGPNESNKAFENKCYLLYEINIFRINNSRVRKVIHGRLSAGPARSHRSSPGFQARLKPRLETRRLAGGISWSRRQSTMDSLIPSYHIISSWGIS